MTNDIIILGSTGSIGQSTLSSINKNKKFKVKLISTKKNIKKILQQAIYHNVRDVIIEDKKEFNKYQYIFKKKKIKLHLGLGKINKIIKKKVHFCVNAISGLDGLEPTLKLIPFSKNILIANKESIICGWDLINKRLKKYKSNFIPLDSEHYSIYELIKNEKIENINKIILTASGGPFLNKSKKDTLNIKPKLALNHPNWKMGKKISIDSSTMMNKVFELIEATKIFNLSKKKFSILVHTNSYIHAIVFFKGEIIKLLAHDTDMKIPISNALGIKNSNKTNVIKRNLQKLNDLNFQLPKKKKFPVISILDMLPDKTSYFETILITINDALVEMYLNSKINYVSIQSNILNLLKKPYLRNFYKLKPKSIYDIKKMNLITKKYLYDNYKFYKK